MKACAWKASRKARLAAVALAALLALAAVPGCYRSSGDEGGGSPHTETVDQTTFREVRDGIDAEGFTVGGRDVLMYAESDTRVRAEGEFTAEDGTSYGTLTLERQGEEWKVVGRK